MRFRIIASSLAVILLAGGLAAAKDTPDQKREKTRKMAAQTLEDLYRLQPTSREFIQKSAGYAVFSDTEPALSKVESGWDDSAQTDAAAKTSKSGGAYSGAASVAPGVWVYQITKTGLALQLSLQGTKYYKGDDLNKP
jgi:hypothetical protein